MLIKELHLWKARFGAQNVILSLIRENKGSRRIKIAEGGADIPTRDIEEPEGDVTADRCPVNVREARDYGERLDKILKKFKNLLRENKKDALETTIIEVNQHMAQQFNSMAAANTGIVLSCVRDPSCSFMREFEQEENVKEIDSDDDTPSRPEVLQWLPPGRWYTSTVRNHIISLFDHITNAQLEASLAVANISSLAKIADAETLDIVLKAAVRPLVQINVPEKFLNPAANLKLKSSTEERKQKIIIKQQF